MNMEYKYYQKLIAYARKMLWLKASNIVDKDQTLMLPMVMVHIMAQKFSFPLNFPATPELYLMVRNAFFHPYSHIHMNTSCYNYCSLT